MKIKYFFIWILVFFALNNTFAKETRFFLMSKLVGPGDLQRVSGAVSYFVTTFDNKLKDMYPCTTLLTENDIGVLLGHEKQRNLLGSETPGLMKNISEAMDCEFLISLEIGTLPGEKFIVSASVIPYTTRFPIFHASAYSDLTTISGAKNLANCDEVAQKLVDSLDGIEICAFTGQVSITINSVIDSTNTVDYSVYCNEMDQRYHKELKIKNNTSSEWKLERKGISWTDGTMTFDSNEESKLTEENSCYKCKKRTRRRPCFHRNKINENKRQWYFARKYARK